MFTQFESDYTRRARRDAKAWEDAWARKARRDTQKFTRNMMITAGIMFVIWLFLAVSLFKSCFR